MAKKAAPKKSATDKPKSESGLKERMNDAQFEKVDEDAPQASWEDDEDDVTDDNEDE